MLAGRYEARLVVQPSGLLIVLRELGESYLTLT
jgi:hypothetical protein